MISLQTGAESVFAIDAGLIKGTSTGDSTYWTSLVSGLGQLQNSAKYLLFSKQGKPAGLDLDERFHWVTVPARSSRWWSLVAFPLAARRMGAGAIHTQYSLSPLVGKRGVTTIHDISFLIGPDWFKPKDRTILRTTVPMAIRRAAQVITVSETSRREILTWIPFASGKTTVTALACPDWIHREDRVVASEKIQNELGLTGPFVLTVGTRWPRKNMKLALEAMERLPAQLPHNLVITGKPGWGEEHLGKRGIAVGYVDNDTLSRLYSAADLYLAPSLHEGFGIPVLEAFRCGCPVLCSSGGALPEVAGDAAMVEESWDSVTWSRSIAGLLDDPSKLSALKDRGIEREKLYSWAETARKTLEVYREVAK